MTSSINSEFNWPLVQKVFTTLEKLWPIMLSFTMQCNEMHCLVIIWKIFGIRVVWFIMFKRHKSRMSLNVDLKSEKRNMYIDHRNLPFYSPTWFRKSLDFSMKLIWSWSGNGIPCFWILQERFIKVLTQFLRKITYIFLYSG